MTTEQQTQDLARREGGGEVDTRSPAQILTSGLRSDTFREQIAMALPSNVTVDRFIRAAVTAIMQPGSQIAEADRESVILAAIRCAQDGLLPDGREAALVVYKGKAQYLPMIGGLRKALADYGWTLRTRAVYAADEFSFTEEPAEIRHVPGGGADRGELVYAYAIATHKDGRRIQRVVFKEEVEKRRALAQTKAVWDKWPAEMWEKTAGHILFHEIPLSEVDEERDRIARIMAAWEVDPSKAVAAIYGADGKQIAVARELTPGSSPADVVEAEPSLGTDRRESDETRGGDAEQGDGPTGAAPVAVASSEPALEEPPIQIPDAVIDNAAATVISSNGKTIAEILALETGPKWVAWGLGDSSTLNDEERSALKLVVQHRAPELWAAHTAEAA